MTYANSNRWLGLSERFLIQWWVDSRVNQAVKATIHTDIMRDYLICDMCVCIYMYQIIYMLYNICIWHIYTYTHTHWDTHNTSRGPNSAKLIVKIQEEERLLWAGLFHKTPKTDHIFVSIDYRGTLSIVQAIKCEVTSYFSFPWVSITNHCQI